MRIALYIFLALVALALGSFTWAYFYVTNIPTLEISENASLENKIEQIDAYLQDLQEKGRFNGAILIAKDHQPLLMKGYGWHGMKKEKALTPQSSFRLASVSKQFTATGILILKEKGLLDLDAPVITYLKDYPYPEVKVRHLLNQTSGTPDNYMSLFEKHKEKKGDTLSIQGMVQLVSQHPEEVLAKAGTTYQYSNTNYVLLAGIVETVSGQTFEAFMQSELFEPMGMKNSRVWNLFSAEETFPNKTDDFDGMLKKTLKPTLLDGVAGDGAVFCSVEDFLIWDKFWYGNDIISQESINEAFTPPSLPDGKETNYGFGWVIQGNMIWHNGSWLGARTFFGRNVKEKTCIALLDNSSNLNSEGILREIQKAGILKDK